jgi:multiple sugar transport system substrate-binding protein
MTGKVSQVLALLVLVTLALTSCAPVAAPTVEPAAPAAEKEVEAPTESGEWSLAKAAEPWKGETLTMIGEALPPLEALQELEPEFEEITGVNVVIEALGHEEAVEKVTLDFAGQTGVYDLVLQPHRALGKLVDAGWLRPVEEFYNDPALRDPSFSFEGDLLNDVWFRETNTYQGKIYGLPFHFISMYLWYRYDWFEHPDEQAAFKEKYGYDLPSPPVTWDEYRDAAEFFTRKTGETLAGEVLENDVYGHAWGAARHVSTWYDFLNVLYSFGGRDIQLPDNRGDSYGPVTVNSEEGLATLEYIIDLIQYAPPGVLSYTWDEKQAAQQSGIVAMAIQWDDATFAVEDPEQSKAAGKIAYSGVPIGKEKVTQIEGWSYFIPTSSKKPELAWLFIQWAMGKDIQVAQMLLGGESALRTTYEDERVTQIPYVPTAVYLKTGGQWVLSTRKVGDPTGLGVPERYLEAINPATGDTSVTMVAKPTFPEEERLTEAIILAVNRAVGGEVSSQEALNSLAAEMEEILPDQ